jgi:tryptophan 7-halogenase
MKEIVIVGGGTAGWITALIAQRALPKDCKLTLIQSEEIGILGAGEGTTPTFVQLMDWLNIPFSDFVEKTGSTFKHGGKFTNWLGDGTHYWHNFGTLPTEISGDAFDSYSHNFNHNNLYYHTAVDQETNFLEIDFPALLCEQYKVPHLEKPIKDPNTNPINNYYQLTNFAVHFDAVKVAAFLKDVGIKRGVNWVEGKVVSIQDDEKGNITNLVLENGTEINTDFVFDCTGFHKLIIGRHYKSKWKSLQDKLTIKASLPFFLPPAEHDKIPPYTEAIAMKYGWIWKIPLQHRFGCGYSYDTDYITKEEAKQEVIDYLGFEPEFGNSFSFRAGHLETPWVNNCIAIGISSAFLEPLEASSIWTTTYFLEILFSDAAQLFIDDKRIRDNYNYRFNYWWTEVSDFIYLHYMGGRTDTPFWAKYQDPNNTPEGIKHYLDKWEWALPRHLDFTSPTGDRAFYLQNWFEVCYGLGLLNKERTKASIQINQWEDYAKLFNNKQARQKEVAAQTIGHGDMLKILGGLREN